MQLAEEIALRNDGAPITTIAIAAPDAPGGVGASLEETTPRGVQVVHKRAFLGGSIRHGRLPAMILQAAQKERFGLLLVSEEGDRTGGALLTRRFLEELFRAAPCPVLALRL
jgi:hypothetical protein